MKMSKSPFILGKTMEHIELIQKHAAKAFQVSENEVIVKERFLGGMSNITYHISIDKKEYTYRIIGREGHQFVNFETEKQNLEIIKPLHICNETVYLDILNGEKASTYIEGTILSTVDYHPYLKKVAELLKKLHNSGLTPASDYGLIDRLDRYESLTHMRTPMYQDLKERWIELYLEEHQNQPKVFCHNDAQRSNILIGQDQLYLLDWEFAGLNEFYYDIASFGNIRFEDALELLDVYLGRPATLKEINSVKFYRMFQALQWHQVALRKEMIGLSDELKINFKMFAGKYLDLANRLYHEIKGKLFECD